VTPAAVGRLVVGLVLIAVLVILALHVIREAATL